MTALAEPVQAELDISWEVPAPAGPTAAMIAEYGWEVFGRCAGEDPDVMFPEPDDYTGQIESLRICAECPLNIKAICRQEKGDAEYGTVAGELDTERAARKEREAEAEKRRKNRDRQRERRAALRAA